MPSYLQTVKWLSRWVIAVLNLSERNNLGRFGHRHWTSEHRFIQSMSVWNLVPRLDATEDLLYLYKVPCRVSLMTFFLPGMVVFQD
jgi:hypothetical protein